MEILSREDKNFLLQLGFAACLKGEVLLAARMFHALRAADPEGEGAKIGFALICITKDRFEEGEELLLGIAEGDGRCRDEALGLMCMSCALQGDRERLEKFRAMISPDAETALRLAQSASDLCDRA